VVQHGQDSALLLQELVEQQDLILEPDPQQVRLEKARVVLGQLVPDQFGESGLHFGMSVEGVHYLSLRQVQGQASFDAQLHRLYVCYGGTPLKGVCGWQGRCCGRCHGLQHAVNSCLLLGPALLPAASSIGAAALHLTARVAA
jgi:hypothetical protein